MNQRPRRSCSEQHSDDLVDSFHPGQLWLCPVVQARPTPRLPFANGRFDELPRCRDFSLFGYVLTTGQLSVPSGALVTGLVTGCVFVSSLSLMTKTLDRAPAGAVFTAFRTSIVVPVVLGVWLWQESITLEQLTGILLSFLALVMMTPRVDGRGQVAGPKAIARLLAIFLLEGCSHSCLRSIHYNGLDDAFLAVLMVMGGTAGTVGWLAIALTKRRPQRGELKLGGFIGVYNVFALCAVLIALSHLPGTLFFPAIGCSVILLDNLAAHFFWQERLNLTAAAGVAVAALAIFLVV